MLDRRGRGADTFATPNPSFSPVLNALPPESIPDRVADFYPVGRFLRGYIRGKLRADPAFEAVWERVKANPLPLVDIGCGLGLLGIYLRLRGYRAAVTGIDTDPKKIALAATVADAGGFDLAFRVADAGGPVPDGGHTVLLDVLHYLSGPAQSRLLGDLARGMRSGGSAIIRNTPRDGSWRYRMTVLEEWWVRASGWIPSRAPICFPTINEVVAPFDAEGCSVEVLPLWGKTPFNSHLFVFKKP